MKPRSAKNKGLRLQNWVAEKISDLLDLPKGKDELIASRPMGQSGTDVVLKGEARERHPYSIECKNCESWSVPAWIKQAKENQIPGTDWVIFAKKNNEHPVVIMDAERWFKILEEKNGKNR